MMLTTGCFVFGRGRGWLPVALHQVLGGVAAVPFGIVEADQVGQALVAEEQRQPRRLLQRQGW
jgi:hypothetical protein